MKPFTKIALFVVFFIALGGILGALYMFNKQHKDLSKVTPDYLITAVDLQKEFEEAEVASTVKYVNKVLEVTGTIESVSTGEENILSLTLKTGSDFSSVICTFPAGTDPTEFSPGKEISLRGECSGFLMDVLMNKCVIIK